MSPLFEGLTEADLRQVLTLMTRIEAPAGARLFTEGERGEHLLLVERGTLRVSASQPRGGERVLAELGPGAVVGEIALLAGGRRTASITTLTKTAGWVIDRRAVEALRHDPRPGAIALLERLGSLALARLREKYERVRSDLGDEPLPLRHVPLEQAPPGAAPLSYLASLLCFARFDRPADVGAVVAAQPLRAVARGDVVIGEREQPPALLLVARGAVELVVRGHERQHRVHLAGPGRFIGCTGVLDDLPSPVLARARERAILVELPRLRVHGLLAEGSPAGRAFAAAVYEDVARAVRQADRPMAATACAQPEIALAPPRAA